MKFVLGSFDLGFELSPFPWQQLAERLEGVLQELFVPRDGI